jgi:uncharacterized membrane protein YjjP (DUF1212 family)
LATINILIVHYLSGKFYLVIIAFILSSIIGSFQQIIVERFAHFARESWTRVRISPSLPQQLGGSGTIANSPSQVDDSQEVEQNLIRSFSTDDDRKVE